jgi:hypothetical protein
MNEKSVEMSYPQISLLTFDSQFKLLWTVNSLTINSVQIISQNCSISLTGATVAGYVYNIGWLCIYI